MIRAVLFDLDGTLLRLDTGRFIEAYVRLLAQWFSPRIPPERFVPRLLAATRRMLDNRDPAKTTKEVFDEAFYPALGLDAAAMAPFIAQFYERAHPALRSLAAADPAARRAVQVVLDRGRRAVLATNPIFPDVAVRQRMAWAGIADLPFALVTTYETAHFCKPHREYFLEVARAVGCDPQECLFVGNDGVEDRVATEVGMQTYLVTDHLVNPGSARAETAARGGLAELPDFLAAVL
ncbi:MAG: HAD family hydrolase [Armatimonadota bacterium]|nr:HAD family hydrolase [Armatimonadota bacterium]MDR7450524.1 HAD family hydrolase [Armatimonadota bacterium]MDR7466343.1 HAD family hydrolase [Armatimonadota bacterium]MDR7493064.1 HAD family hydrolase [Armatimonadota bacterium]MDR7498179.1 HAD family hydrolase [Armatimonadota bacterium]